MTYGSFLILFSSKSETSNVFKTYLKIIIETIKNWKSFDKLKNLKLENTIKKQLHNFINDLTEIHYHPKLLVDRFFGYINASKDGLTENEIIDLLSLDENLTKILFNKLHCFWLRNISK